MKERQFRNKITWFSFLFSILVIWVHSFNAELFLGKSEKGQRIYELEAFFGRDLAQIAVPGFFMISSYLFYRNFREGIAGVSGSVCQSPAKNFLTRLWEKWESRIRSVLVPYLLWNAIYYMGYVIGSRLPFVEKVVGKGIVPVSLEVFVDAVLHYRYLYVFWYLYQLILLILLAPVLYLLLKNIRISMVFLAAAAACAFFDVRLPALNADALFYYCAAAWAAIHGRRIVEQKYSAERRVLGAWLMGAGILCHLLMYRSYHTGFVVMCRLLVPVGLWFFVNEEELPQAYSFMKNNFFIYAVHFAFVRLINKTAALFLPRREWVPLLLFLCMPFIMVLIGNACAFLIKKISRPLWKLLNGGR